MIHCVLIIYASHKKCMVCFCLYFLFICEEVFHILRCFNGEFTCIAAVWQFQRIYRLAFRPALCQKNNSIKVRGCSYTVSNRNFNKYMEILTHGNVFMWITKRTRVSTDRCFWCTVYRDHVMRHTRHQPPKYPPLNPVKLRKLIYF